MVSKTAEQRPYSGNPRQPTQADEVIGERIRARRQDLSLRQEDLAGKLNITPHQLQKYETGQNRIAASRLLECAGALEVPVGWFFQGQGVADVKRSDALDFEERELVGRFRALTAEGKVQLLGIAKLLKDGSGGVLSKSRRVRMRASDQSDR